MFVIVLLGLSLRRPRPRQPSCQGDLGVGAVCLLVVYGAWVVPYLRSDRAPGERPRGGRRRARRALPPSSVPGRGSGCGSRSCCLSIGGVASAFVSDWFVNAPRAGDLDLEPLASVRRAGDRRDRRQRRREHGRARAGLEAPQRPRDLGRQKLRRPDRRVPVPAAGADLLRPEDHAHVRASRPSTSARWRSPRWRSGR